MDATLDFLNRILPSEGVYVSIIVRPDNVTVIQRFHDTQEALASYMLHQSAQGENVYYAVSSFKDKSSRKQPNVLLTKCLFLDIDCGEGKPFPDWKAGLVALGKFVADVGLPKPLVVSSGNGLHVYWVLTETLEPARWKPMAEQLKALVPRFVGLDKNGKPNFDPAVPADSARVLRAIGTVNPKGGGEVKILINHAPVTTPEDMEKILAKHSAIPAAPKTVAYPTKSTLFDTLSARPEYPPAIAQTVMSKCAQIKWAVENQAEVPEPLWYAVLGVAAYCENPEATAIAWSKEYPQYDEAETLRKLQHWSTATTGPATCARFNSERPEGCEKCKFKDKIGSPARLGIQYKEVDAPKDAPDDSVNIIPPPRPFKRTASGMKMTVDGTDVDVCKFDIYPVSYGRDEILGYEVVRFRWNRPHIGWQDLMLRQAHLIDKCEKDFLIACADQGIVHLTKKQAENFHYMLRAYMEELRQLRSMTNLYATQGWKENFTQFLLGDTLYKLDPNTNDVTTEAVLMSGTTQTSNTEMFSVAGDKEAYIQFTSLLEKGKLYPHMFGYMIGMSSVLYAYTGLSGAVINFYGPTGSGKTLLQYLQQSIWGNPKELHLTAKFTQNALFTKLGYYNNLPVTIDETTMISPKEIGDFLYWITQGRDKLRLTKNSEEKDARTWSTTVTTSSNKSFGSLLLASGMETDAQQARLLDIPVNKHPLFAESTRIGERIYNFLSLNYGHTGPVLIDYLLKMGPEGVRAMIAEHKDNFAKKYGVAFAGHERYWEQVITLADLMGKIAKESGLIQFKYEEATQWALSQLGVLRETVRENTTDAFDLIAEYINEHGGETLTVMHVGSNKGTPDYNRMPRESVYVRFDVYKKTPAAQFDHGTVMLDRRHFKKWLALRGADYRSISKRVTEENAKASPKHDKCYMGKDTPIKLAQTYVLGLNLSHPRLKGMLEDIDEGVDNATLGQLTVVK